NPPPPATVTDPGQYLPIGTAPSGTHNASAPGTFCGPSMGRTFSGISVTSAGDGYGLVDTAGENYDFGTVASHGNPAGFTGSIVGVSVTADGQGYANVSSAGQNYDYGTVVSHGNPTGFTGNIVGVSVTANGQGYADLSSIGQVYAY